MASLLVLKGVNPNQRFKLDSDLIVLGRNPDCQIIIQNNAVSRQHAQIRHVGGRFFIEDLDSRNRTYVNNQEIAPAQSIQLREGDRIKICDYLFRFDTDSQGEKVPLPPIPDHLQPGREELPEIIDTPSPPIEATLDSRLPQGKFLQAQSAERLRALLEISGTLNKTLDLETLLPKIADTLFGVFRQADRCFVILRDETSGRLIPKVVKTRRSLGDGSTGFSRTIVKQCLETQQALLSEDASANFPMNQSISEFRIRSVMCVPLATQDGKPLGVIQLDSQDRGKKFTEDDLRLLIAVANHAAVALENAQLHLDLVERERVQRDLELAQKVQMGFLPQRLPQMAGYEFYAFYQSALTIGGDYYDFIKLPDGRLAVLLGDVAGKGVSAALLMVNLSVEARVHVMTQPDAAQTCTALNRTLATKLLDQNRFITLAMIVLDPLRNLATVVKAGHDTPWVFRRASGRFEDLLTRDQCGLPLGVMEDIEYESATVELAPGDLLVMFTDGVTDALSLENKQFSADGVRRAVQEGSNALPITLYTAPQLGDRIVQAVKQHAAGQYQADDIALVCLGRAENGPSTLSSDTTGKRVLSPTPLPSD